MNKKSLFSGIAIATAVLGLGMTNPVEATSSIAKTADISSEVSGRSQLLQTPSSELIAYRRCRTVRVYHRGSSSRRFGIVGRRQYRPGYYTTRRVCN
ncbi:MAG: hypothetical protein PUP93_34210 [Rhizonema sp. NSF051]|nr:hypothetical protein [Rhizonema sp. NSF051]